MSVSWCETLFGTMTAVTAGQGGPDLPIGYPGAHVGDWPCESVIPRIHTETTERLVCPPRRKRKIDHRERDRMRRADPAG